MVQRPKIGHCITFARYCIYPVYHLEEVRGTGELSAGGGCGAGGVGTWAECQVHPLPQSPIYEVVGIAEVGATNSKMAIGRTMDMNQRFIHSFVRQSVDRTIQYFHPILGTTSDTYLDDLCS